MPESVLAVGIPNYKTHLPSRILRSMGEDIQVGVFSNAIHGKCYTRSRLSILRDI